jgi:hypothetical protein
VQRQQPQEQQQLAGQDAEAQQRWFWREAEILRQCAHPSLVQLLGVYSSAPPPPQQQQTSLQQTAQQQQPEQPPQRRQLMIIQSC